MTRIEEKNGTAARSAVLDANVLMRARVAVPASLSVGAALGALAPLADGAVFAKGRTMSDTHAPHADHHAVKNDAGFFQAPVVGSKRVPEGTPGAAVVYFTKTIDAAHLKKLYSLVNGEIVGKVAVKLHTGERHGPNIIPRDMAQALLASIPNSNIVETNTLYHGDRDTTEKHRKTLEINGWTFCPVDIMDADGATLLPVKGGRHLKEVSMGKTIRDYDSMVVLTHFKGHAMGGFGGSMKNIAIGCADGKIGKAQVHAVDDVNKPWDQWPAKEHLMETMSESAKAVCDHFGKRITFLNVMRRMSVDCDCAGLSAAEPTIGDAGILASTDILAVDQACVDLVYQLPNNHDLVERIESRRGLHQLEYMAQLGMGAKTYTLIEVL